MASQISFLLKTQLTDLQLKRRSRFRLIFASKSSRLAPTQNSQKPERKKAWIRDRKKKTGRNWRRNFARSRADDWIKMSIIWLINQSHSLSFVSLSPFFKLVTWSKSIQENLRSSTNLSHRPLTFFKRLFCCWLLCYLDDLRDNKISILSLIDWILDLIFWLHSLYFLKSN